MTRALKVHRIGPGASIQDMGRPGFLTFGLSRGGAADRLAVEEGAALLGQSSDLAALEMPGAGGTFEATEDTRIALTGAPMRADIDGVRLAWNASHLLPTCARLSIGAAESGSVGYLSVGGGFATPERLGSRSTHFAAGIGEAIAVGDTLPVGADTRDSVNMKIAPDLRFSGGKVRIVPSMQTAMFAEAELQRFENTAFRKDLRANRMGMRLLSDGEGFRPQSGLSIVSEVILPGDIQITGDGTPFALLCECGTTGGYPRIGSILPCDLPRVVQAAAGTELQFAFVTLDEAVDIATRERAAQATRTRALEPLVRDPREIKDLLSYELIGGVTDGSFPVDT